MNHSLIKFLSINYNFFFINEMSQNLYLDTIVCFFQSVCVNVFKPKAFGTYNAFLRPWWCTYVLRSRGNGNEWYTICYKIAVLLLIRLNCESLCISSTHAYYTLVVICTYIVTHTTCNIFLKMWVALSTYILYTNVMKKVLYYYYYIWYPSAHT